MKTAKRKSALKVGSRVCLRLAPDCCGTIIEVSLHHADLWIVRWDQDVSGINNKSYFFSRDLEGIHS
jgi:hypothetical protein